LKNKLGLHARPCTMIVSLARNFGSEIYIEKLDENGKPVMKVNAKSLFALLTLTAPQGTRLRIIAEGPDAKDAVEALVKLIEVEQFNED